MNNPKRRKIVLWLKFAFVFGFIFLLIFIPVGILICKKISYLARESVRRELMAYASAASASIDVIGHEEIKSPEDEDTPLYEEVRAPLKKIVALNPDIDSVYTLRRTKEENIFSFVLDSADPYDSNGNGIIDPEEDRAHVGEKYDASLLPEMEKAFAGPTADYKINCDKWGCWLSGYAPILDRQGEAVALVGVDINAERVLAFEKETKKMAFVFGFFILAFLLIYIFLVTRFFIYPINELARDVEKFASDLSYRIRLKENDEFGKIARAFNSMAGKIEQLTRGLEKKVQERTKELRRANKKLEEIDRMRKEFVSHTAHELMAPLNVFRWSVEMLQSEDLGKINLKQREVLDQIHQSSSRLINLVNDLLEISRIDEARLKIAPAPCQIEELIDAASGNLSVKIKEKQFDFIWKKPKPPLPKVRADKDKIFEVILNILGNAVKFTPDGGKIEVKTLLIDKIAPKDILKKYGFVQKDKEYVLVSISDTGMGIPKTEQEKMFSRFFRASNVKREQIEGTGLGMAIVFEIIKLHNGAVWFESEEGVGTTFYFTLPTF